MTAPAWFAPLARLAFARGLPLAGITVIATGLALLRWREETRAAELLALPAGAALDAAGAVRETLWTACALFLVPWSALRCARQFARWRTGELDFLAPRAAPRAGLVAAVCAGHVAACAVLVATVAFACEVGRSRTPTFRAAEAVPLPSTGWITGRAPYAARLGDREFAPGARLEVELVLGAGAGPATEVVLALAREGGARSEHRERLGARGRIEAEVPEGNGALVLSLALTDPEARVFLGAETARAWTPADDARAASVELALRLLALAAAASAVALALSAWLAPALATAGTLALALFPAILDADVAAFPARGLGDALEAAGRARVPGALEPAPIVAACALVALAIVLCAASRPAWRRTR